MSKLKNGQTIELENVLTGEVTRGIVKERISKNKVLIETPDGQQKVVDLLQFIVTIIPLLDTIITWIGQKISRLFKKKRRESS